jgi:ABC-type multidrug transport system ATPase subunit
VTAVVGPNGAGKTNLFRALLGFLSPDEGRVTVGGLSPARHRRVRGIGYLPERATLPSGWTVAGLLRRGARISSGGDPDEAQLEALRRRYGLEGRGRDRVGTLSRGLSRRLALAFALLGEPGIVLLDEPLAGLDPPGRGALEAHVRNLGKDGVTVLLGSHDLHAVARVADRVAILMEGKVERIMYASALRSGGGVRRLRAMMGASEAFR